jgi:ketosteroid isomerase-like protein
MEPSEDLQAALLSLYAAMGSGDADAVEALYSLQAGSVFVGTDAAEFWTDSAQHNADVRPYFDGSAVRVTAGEPIAIVEGSVGWTVDRPAFRLADGTVFELRLTLVWHREGGSWRVVHSHASVGAG